MAHLTNFPGCPMLMNANTWVIPTWTMHFCRTPETAAIVGLAAEWAIPIMSLCRYTVECMKKWPNIANLWKCNSNSFNQLSNCSTTANSVVTIAWQAVSKPNCCHLKRLEQKSFGYFENNQSAVRGHPTATCEWTIACWVQMTRGVDRYWSIRVFQTLWTCIDV